MKILHTSDWHLGAMLGPQKRYGEFDQALDWLIGVLEREKIEAVIISGDVFDSNLPSNRATEQYYDFLVRARAAGVRKLIVTAGNHDSASFLDAPGELLKHFSVHVAGHIDTENTDSAVIPLEDPAGKIEAVVCAVPYLRDCDIRRAVAGEGIDEQEKRRLDGVLLWYRKVCARAVRSVPVKIFPAENGFRSLFLLRWDSVPWLEKKSVSTLCFLMKVSELLIQPLLSWLCRRFHLCSAVKVKLSVSFLMSGALPKIFLQ